MKALASAKLNAEASWPPWPHFHILIFTSSAQHGHIVAVVKLPTLQELFGFARQRGLTMPNTALFSAAGRDFHKRSAFDQKSSDLGGLGGPTVKALVGFLGVEALDAVAAGDAVSYPAWPQQQRSCQDATKTPASAQQWPAAPCNMSCARNILLRFSYAHNAPLGSPSEEQRDNARSPGMCPSIDDLLVECETFVRIVGPTHTQHIHILLIQLEAMD